MGERERREVWRRQGQDLRSRSLGRRAPCLTSRDGRVIFEGREALDQGHPRRRNGERRLYDLELGTVISRSFRKGPRSLQGCLAAEPRQRKTPAILDRVRQQRPATPGYNGGTILQETGDCKCEAKVMKLDRDHISIVVEMGTKS